VLDALSDLGLQGDVAGLLELANRGLAGEPTGGASISQINQAVDAINRGFDKCRFLTCCGEDCLPDLAFALFNSNENEDDQETEAANIPKEFSLSQSYPNPFNPACVIKYALPKDCQVTLNIYNILGQKVTVLVDEYQSAGYKSVRWNANDHQGQELASGIYFYMIKAGDFVQTKKMLLIR